MNISQRGLDLIARFEGLRLTAYRDIAGVLTVGYGHTGKDVYEGQTITEDRARELLQQDAQTAVACVNAANSHLTQNQFDALVSFAYNLGCLSLNMMMVHGWNQIPVQILRWDIAGGVVVPGLKARREAELALFQTP
jgi:lysozyme